MREKLSKIRPSKNNIYSFLFNALLLSATLWFGHYYIKVKLIKIDQEKIEYQNLVDEKKEFIKNFARLAENKIYSAENFYKNKIGGVDNKILDRSWENYMQATYEWSGEHVLNSVFIGYYFSNELKDEYNNILVPRFEILHSNLVKTKEGECVADMENIIENAKNELYIVTERLLFERFL
ncbi:MAG: hypothetical protein U9O55_03655 [Patescibacteria group bacterium]|nr:hypothetical protein [Patescibacteria group bacterium]